MPIFVAQRKRFDIVKNYPDLSVARILSNINVRGLFILEVTDDNDPTNPDRWEIMIEGGTTYQGDNAKYFPFASSSVNVVSIVKSPAATIKGFDYDLVDVFGRKFKLTFNGQRSFTPTIQQIAGPAMVGPVNIRIIVFQ